MSAVAQKHFDTAYKKVSEYVARGYLDYDIVAVRYFRYFATAYCRAYLRRVR